MKTPHAARRHPNCPSGFTLIELVFVALVLVVLLVLSLPSFQRTAQRLRTEQTAFELAQSLRFAREQAITQQQTIAWVWDESLRRVHLELVEADGERLAVEERLVRGPALPAWISLQMTREDADAQDVQFFPDGTSQPATLLVSGPGGAYTVTVDEITGGVRLSANATR